MHLIKVSSINLNQEYSNALNNEVFSFLMEL